MAGKRSMDVPATDFDRLLRQVEILVAESGDPTSFDAKAWLASWLGRPIPAFGGARPREFLGTEEGRQLVSQAITQMQSGAYA